MSNRRKAFVGIMILIVIILGVIFFVSQKGVGAPIFGCGEIKSSTGENVLTRSQCDQAIGKTTEQVEELLGKKHSKTQPGDSGTGNTETIQWFEGTILSDGDYESCSVTFNNGEATKRKWKKVYGWNCASQSEEVGS